VVLRRSSDLAAQLAGARHRIAELERELAERATYDELSGLLSAQRLHARLESEVQRTQRHHRPLTVGLIDADGFRGSTRPTGAPRGRVAGDAGDALGPESEAQRDAVSALAVALLERDQYTGEHSESVVEMATSVARGLGSDQREVDAVGAGGDPRRHPPQRRAPARHRQGKLMKEHTVIGERILRAIPGMGAVARIVRHEHERWDGRGYPDGISGEEIPVGSRIILACDAYHAMTSHRSYRAAMSHPQAIEELTENVNSQFDPKVVRQLVGHLYSRRQVQGLGAGADRATSTLLACW